MAQKKKGIAPAGGVKRKASRGGISWQASSGGNHSRMIALIAIVGVIAILAGYFLESSAVFSVNAADDSASANVRINELQSENLATIVTETGDVPDWIEILNTGRETVNVGKYSLLLESNINKMFTFPDYELKPGENLLVYAAGTSGARGEWNAPFKLEASGGDTLVLLNAQGKAIDGVALPELGADASYSRQDDGSWMITAATPGRENGGVQEASSGKASVQVSADAVELSEVMSSNSLYFADENGECHDYVELHNVSGMDINLQGWYLSDSSDKLKRWAFPAVTLPAYGYLAVHCSGYNRTENAAHLHTDFKIGSGEDVYLSRPDGQTVSAVTLPALENGQAYSLVDGAWSIQLAATPGLANTVDAASQVHTYVFGDRRNGVHISEIMALPTQQDYDWVEIYNGSGQAMDLSNYGLSDDADKPRKWQFPQGTVIQPGEYLGVYLSGTRQSSVGGFLNADFALGAEGGSTVTLSGPDGRIFDAVYLPQQYGGVSYGRAQNRNGFYFFEQGTPGTSNSGASYSGKAQEAVCSVQGGLFKTGDSFTVELSAPEGSRIFYTLDCSDPSERANLYTGPITISGTTILRSRVYRDGCMPSFIDTQSYLYDVYNEGNVFVVSVVSDPDNLFSEERGIMIKGPNALEKFPYGSMNRGANFWMDWEREGHVEVFEPDGTPAFGQGCGLKLHGQYSRATDVKAFKVIARSEYGSNRFEYPLFSDRPYDEYQSFVLRASGQDWNMTFMRDSVLTSLAADTSVMYQESEVGVCYLNGRYYTLYNLRERINKHSVCQFEGWEGMEDDIDLIKANDKELQGSNATFDELIEWLKKNDVTTQAAYDYIDARIDIQNYIEYMAIEIFVGNGDTLNVKRYRNAKDDGKWRWCLFDLDWAFYVDTDSIGRWLEPGGMGTNKYTDNTLFISCMKNPVFREKFLTYFGERMATTFTTENMLSLFMERYELIDGLLPAYQEQWGIKLGGMKKLWNYCETRPAKLLGYFKETFNFSNAEMEKYFGEAIKVIRAYESKEADESNGE